MKKDNSNRPSSGGAFNTLAQTRTNNAGQTPVIVMGKGSDLNDEGAVIAKKIRKTITQHMALGMIDIAKAEGNEEMVNALWNTYHCQSKITTANGRSYGVYCKNKFCTVCNANRKADLINKYRETIQEWEDAYFVTLTIRSVPYTELKKYMKAFTKGFSRMIDRCRKRYERGTGIKLVGIRSLECNFNAKKRTYNPHYHVIVPDKATAELLRKEWLKTVNKNKDLALPYNQNMKPIWSKDGLFTEVIKYGTKITTVEDPNNKQALKGNEMMYLNALYEIFQALRGKRLFEHFGFKIKPKNKQLQNTVLHEYSNYTYESRTGNWRNNETDDPLVEHVLPHYYENLFENRVDRERR